MKKATDRIGENKLGDAKQAQDAAADTLKKVQNQLAEQADRTDDAERLAKKLKGMEQELDDRAAWLRALLAGDDTDRQTARSADRHHPGVPGAP